MLLYKEFESTRRFGVELEVGQEWSKTQLGDLLLEYEWLYRFGKCREISVESGAKGWAETNSNDYWHVKYDSTCGPLGKGKDAGWEIASYIASGNDDIMTISRAAGYLKDKGVRTNDNCGLHIHVDVSDFDVTEIGVLFGHWIKVEKMLFQACPPRRRKSRHCRLISKKISPVLFTMQELREPAFLWNIIKPQNLGPYENNDKRVTLNSVGYARGLQEDYHPRKTVELRMPECLLDACHVEHWTRLILNFVENVQEKSMPSDLYPVETIAEMLSYLSLSQQEPLMVLSPELRATKMWLLSRFCEFGATKKLRKEATKLLDFAGRF